MSIHIDILRNFPWCDEYVDESFLGLLHEKEIVSYEEYWKLDAALYIECSKLGTQIKLSRDLVWPIFRIFSHTMLLLGSHFDDSDGFSIKNLSKDEVLVFRERVQLVFEGFFSGEMPDNDIFQVGNPLL